MNNSKRKKIIAMLLVMLSAAFLYACSRSVSSPASTPEPSAVPTATPQPTPVPTPTPEPTPEPPSTTTAKLTACGDIVPHMEVLRDAYTGEYDSYAENTEPFDFVRQFGTPIEYIREADYSFCTVECALTEPRYTYFPLFHAPKQLAQGLKDVGFDMILCASNHSADGNLEGIESTLDTYDAVGLDHVGTYRTEEEKNTNRGVLFKDVNGIKLAFINYTAGTNGVYLYNEEMHYEWAVNNLFETYYNANPANLQYSEIGKDIECARENGADIIIAWFHWSSEYAFVPTDYMYELSDFCFERGVDIILGGHPHVLEPIESKMITDLEGNEKKVYIAYSLGNMLTAMYNFGGDTTAFVNIGLEKNLKTGETEITCFDYVPVFRVDFDQYPEVDIDYAYQLIDLDRDLAAYDSGNNPGYISPMMHNAFVAARSHILQICTEELYRRPEVLPQQ